MLLKSSLIRGLKHSCLLRFAASSSREFPAFPIAAVAVTVVSRPALNEPTQFLLVKRGKDPGKGLWSSPGGGINVGESTLAAAARELAEETGLTDKHVKFYPHPFTSTDAIYSASDDRGTQFHYVISQFIAFATPIGLKEAAAADDAEELGWFSTQEMALLDPPVVPSMLAVAALADRLIEKGAISQSDAVSLTNGT
jgi:ADP-ribose pyrophosphatase YjhB (NUDIX family)